MLWLPTLQLPTSAESSIQSVHAHPGRERHGAEPIGHVDSYAVADAVEPERGLAGPAAFRPFATHDGTVADERTMSRHVGQPTPTGKTLKVKSQQQRGVGVQLRGRSSPSRHLSALRPPLVLHKQLLNL